GHEQPDVFSQCQKCRFIFPIAQRTGPTPTIAAVPSLESVTSGPSIAAFLGALAGATLLAAALWWLWTPAGLAVSENSYVNAKHQFAMEAPPGWVALSPDNYQEMLQQLGNRLPKSLQDGLSNRRIEVGFIKLLEEPNFSPNINVVVMQTEVPELDEKQLEEGARVLSTEFKRLLASYKLEKSELITVDELTCAQFSSSGTLKIKVADAKVSVNESIPGWPRYTEDAPAHWASFDLKMTQTLVPGKKRAYIITCTSDAKQDRDYKRAFDQAVDSFRVLERPARFGPIVMGGLQGGLIASLAYLLYFIVGSLIAFIRR
ncbi:MAG: hypothetical protein NTU47_03920, partial [Ignavibacteriales bacterium]|nr:hypothetical protein [Ignavibacteriales bacterium]